MFTKYFLVLLGTFLSLNLIAGPGPKPPSGSNWVNGKNTDTWDTKRWTVGFQTGILAFHGDLAQSKKRAYGGHFSDTKNQLNAGLLLKYALSHSLSIRISGYAGSFKWTNGGLPYAFYYYNTTNKIKSLEVQVYANLGNVSFLRHERKVNLYLFTGVGTVFNKFSGTMTGVNSNYEDIDFATHPYWSTKAKSRYATVPVGLGILYNLNWNLDLGIESGLRYTRTDSLDFANYPEPRNRNFDYFSQTTIGLYLKLGSKKKQHYDWINPLETVYDDVSDSKKKVKLLTGDADKDGVADYLDKEPETPEGSRVSGAGEALDTDGDGVPDFKDDEPFSDKGQVVDEKGKMLDDDEDGVANNRDLEPNTPKGNLVNFQGKTIPNAGGKTVNTNSGANTNVGYLPTIFFDTDKWYVNPEFYSELLAVSQILVQFPNLKLEVVGNADYRLDDSHNDMLGRNRAEAVIEILVKKFGVDRERLIIRNNGEHIPMVPGRGPAFDPYNRRVNFFVAGSTSEWVK